MARCSGTGELVALNATAAMKMLVVDCPTCFRRVGTVYSQQGSIVLSVVAAHVDVRPEPATASTS